jgi:hypothetical protein
LKEGSMKKMSLDMEQLAVESFETSNPDPRRGTVAGYESETDLVSCTSCDRTYCGQSCEFCSGYNTCNGCTGSACPSWEITCEPTSPDPVGTCCHFQC